MTHRSGLLAAIFIGLFVLAVPRTALSQSSVPCGGTPPDTKADVKIKACTDLLTSNPQSPKKGEWLWWRATAYSDMKEYRLALADLTEAIKIEPTVSRLRSRAGVYEKLKQYALGIADCTEALKLTTEMAETNFTLAVRGGLYLEADKFDEAISDYTTIIDSYRANGVLERAYLARAALLDIKGEKRKAAADRDVAEKLR